VKTLENFMISFIFSFIFIFYYPFNLQIVICFQSIYFFKYLKKKNGENNLFFVSLTSHIFKNKNKSKIMWHYYKLQMKTRNKIGVKIQKPKLRLGRGNIWVSYRKKNARQESVKNLDKWENYNEAQYREKYQKGRTWICNIIGTLFF